MQLLWQARTNPLAWWWALLVLVSAGNIALWFLLYSELSTLPAGGAGGAPHVGLMLVLCAAYVFGCAFRSLLPRADVQRICLFDTWLSSALVGRAVATVAEVSFAAQWAIVLYQLGWNAGADTSLAAAWAVVPLIVVAQCWSWYGVLTTNSLAHAVENSIWAVAFLAVGVGLGRLLPELDGPARLVLGAALVGIAAYLAFVIAIDVPMYLSRWQAGRASGSKMLRPLDGLRDATRWVVTHDPVEWKDEIAWMSLYFTVAVWASLALCAAYALGDQLPRDRTEPAVQAPILVGQQHAAIDVRGRSP